ncbi:BTB/POZ domain-containing protein 6 [Stylophora pistillata]|uniref:BTB/POZ domain-containing protein 6 n=1 Tax=Stylophora pistillata TaxID=50429 RepID=A0A2B4SQC6_STYPI|nr:BTB/POZ domain-containing protein 6 [Stylophora pistillata]
MFTVEKNWRATRPTIKEKTKFLLNSELFSDIKFVVRKINGESESKQLIPAHKFVLSIGSPVFEAMFFSDLAENEDSITLPDAEYESLLEFFHFMYGDEVNLSGSNVMGVLYLAKKYMVPLLADKCNEYLQDNLDPSNAFSVLPSAEKYDEKILVDRCWKMIDKLTKRAVKSDGFLEIDRPLLEQVVKRDTLTIEEIELFKAVDLWATKECERQRLTANGSVKRGILGEDLVRALRFPTMKQEEFTSIVLNSDILTNAEIKDVNKHLSSVATSSTIFPDTKRSGVSNDIKICCRLVRLCAQHQWKYNGRKDCIDFSADKDIIIYGMYLFGVMLTIEKNWQTTKLTIRERTTFMLNNEIFSDVKFVVRKINRESETKQLIPAHKFVLSIGSPVFEAMFYGDLAETKDTIELPDAEYESLLEFFRFIILPSAEKYDEKKLVERCWKVIDKQTEQAMKSDGFVGIDKSFLATVVKRVTLTTKEIELFKAVDLWATKECERQRLTANGSVKRDILGEEIIKAIHFPTMKLEEFVSVVLDSDLLHKAEIKDIIKCLSSVVTSSTIFPDTKRCGVSSDIKQCRRLDSKTEVPGWGYGYGYGNGYRKDGIHFSADKDIELHGLCFFGSHEQSYSVNLELKGHKH